MRAGRDGAAEENPSFGCELLGVDAIMHVFVGNRKPAGDGNELGDKIATAFGRWCQELGYSQGDTINNRIQSRRRDYESYNTISGYLS
jgi:hypothetical protein